MRRLLTLFVSFGILLWARSILAGESAPPDVLLRDGLLVALIGLVIFALNGKPPAYLKKVSERPVQPIPRLLLAGIGFAVALVGSVWLAVTIGVSVALTEAGAGGVSNGGLLVPLALWLIGLGVGFAGLYWPRRQAPSASSPPDVWSLEAARAYLQRRVRDSDEAASAQDEQDWPGVDGRTTVYLLLLLTVVALLLRGWNFAGLPDGCLPAQCDALLVVMDFTQTGNLSDLLTSAAPLYTLAASLFVGVFGSSIASILLLGLVLSALSIPLSFYAARGFVSPASALLGTLFVVFSPLAIVWGRHPVPELVLALLVVGLLALRPTGQPQTGQSQTGQTQTGQTQTATRWAALGAVAGLTLYAAPPPLTWLLLLWFLLTPPERKTHWLYYYLPLAVVSLPRLAAGFGGDLFSGLSVGQFFAHSGDFVQQLLLDGGYLPGLLALLGLAWLVRHLRWDRGWLWTLGLLLVGLPVLASAQSSNPHLLAPLIVLLGIGAVVALDQFVGEFVRVWQSVIPPRRVTTVAAALLVLVLAIGGGSRLNALTAQGADDTDGGYAAIGNYLYERFVDSVDNDSVADNEGDDTLILVPPAVLENPSARLAARGVLPRYAHAIPLDPVRHLPFPGPPFTRLPSEMEMGDLVYIVPDWDADLNDYVGALYPGLIAEPISDGDGHTWARAYSVTRSAAANAQGLPVLYFAGNEIGSPQEAIESRREGPLELKWDAGSPVGGLPVGSPFVMSGQGALLVPEGGIYGFRIETGAGTRVRMDVAAPPPSALALDTDAGISEIVVDLPQGLYRLNLTVYSGENSEENGGENSGDAASPVTIQWRRPDAAWETIPRQVLYSDNPTLGKGLQARYYGSVGDGSVGDGVVGDGVAGDGEQPSGFTALDGAPLIGWRVEPWPTENRLAAIARAVVWQGKVAAPLDGTYGFSVNGQGAYQLEIDGILLLNSDGRAPRAEMSDTSLLLGQGWHDLTLRYQPAGSGTLQLLWQPPAGQISKIPLDYLRPLLADASTAEIALPPPPVQEAQPALAADISGRESETAVNLQPSSSTELPTDLPDLPFSLAWQVGSCGADIEQLQQPRGVALNLYNEVVYIADQGNRRVVLRDLSDGGLVDYYTDDAFEEPFDLDVNLLGQVFLLDAVAQTIYRFEEPAGVAVAQPNETAFYRPRGMGMALDGSFYVADTGGARVVQLAGFNGVVTFQAGGPDSLLGQGQPVDAMALPTGALYVITAQDGMLWRLDTGESWPAVAPANTFDAPHLAGLPTSSFFVSDPERRLITYYDESGRALGQLRSDSFAKPVGIAALILDGQVHLAVSDSNACQVSLWRAPLDALP